MAKGINTFQQLGKIDGRKYYRMKGVDGIISSNINTGMSNRVKNDAAYDNTRRNNYEFGMATSDAGAITRAFSQKWRYLLVPFATAKIAKEVLAAAKDQPGMAWGTRYIDNPDILPLMASVMPKYTKNDISDFGDIRLTASVEEESMSLLVYSASLVNEKAKAAGCDGIRAVVYKSDIKVAEGGYGTKNIQPASCVNTQLGTVDINMGEELELSLPHTFGDSGDLISVVLLPYRTIGTEKYIMQEFCSAKFAHVLAE